MARRRRKKKGKNAGKRKGGKKGGNRSHQADNAGDKSETTTGGLMQTSGNSQGGAWEGQNAPGDTHGDRHHAAVSGDIAGAAADNEDGVWAQVPAIAEEERRKGNKSYHKRNYKEAVAAYTRGIVFAASGSNPSFLVVLFSNRAAAHIGLRNYRDCVEDCTHALVLDSGSVKAHGRRAYAYYCMKRFADAVADYETALQLDPNNTQIAENLKRARDSLASQRERQATADGVDPQPALPEHPTDDPPLSPISLAWRVLPEPADLPPLLGVSYSTRHSDSVGQQVVMREKALEEKVKGNRAFRQGSLVDALRHYTTAITLNPTDPVFYSNRAQVYLLLERFYDAIHDCTISIRIQPSIKAHLRRATAWGAVDHLEKAIEDYAVALKFEPKHLECLAGMEECLHRLEVKYNAWISDDQQQ